MTKKPQDDLVGTVFDGRFRVQRVLGAGGMGTVYLVHHEVLQRNFALKMIHKTLLADPELAQMLRREARAASRVQHPNVTFVFDYSHSPENVPYIVMEYVEGETLGRAIGKLLRAGDDYSFPLLRAVDILAQVADALAAAHAQGVVHRDLKPANVALTTKRGRSDLVKVLDFGLAKLTRGGTLNSIDSRAIFGTPEYMSPEQCLQQDEVDHRTDIYGLGVMAYEMFCGQPPFVGEPLQVLYAHQEKHAQRPSQRLGDSEFPAQLDDLIMRCLAKDPAKRPQSSAELATELRLTLASLRAGSPETLPPHSETGILSPFGSIPTAYVREGGGQGAPGGLGDVAKTLVSEPAALAEGNPGDGESHGMEDLVRALREQDLADENLVHLLSRMLEADDGVLEAELEADLLQGQIVHLEMRTREREARLREALVQIEHESARQTQRVDEPGPTESTPRAVTRQIDRLGLRATELANRIRRVSDALEERLGGLEGRLRKVEMLLGERRDDASNLREILRKQLRKARDAATKIDSDLAALFAKAGL
jgi:serine/threonine protein kinase